MKKQDQHTGIAMGNFQPKERNLTLVYQIETWEPFIKPILQSLVSKKLEDPKLVIKKLQELYFYVHTHRTRSKYKEMAPSYEVLWKLYKKELLFIFRNVAYFVLIHEEKSPSFPIFRAQEQLQHTFTKDEIMLLMCLMSLNLIPMQHSKTESKFHSLTSFEFIFSQEQFKTKTIIEYLKKELKELYNLRTESEKHEKNQKNQKHEENQKSEKSEKSEKQKSKYEERLTQLTLKRAVEKRGIEKIIEEEGNKNMTVPHVAHDKQSIEEFYGSGKVDFANKFIGGGSLSAGCVQEEIMFANHPEMYTSMIFCEVMASNEAIEFTGFKKYFKNVGYAHTCEYDGIEDKDYQYDEKNRAKEYIVAIDAVHFPSEYYSLEQFNKQYIDRELLKAYVGFANSEGKKIVTGNWGCGVFNGNVPLKFMIQWIACSLAGKEMVYVPFGQGSKVKKQKLFDCLKNEKVKKVYEKVVKEASKVKSLKSNILEVVEEGWQK